MEGEFFTCHCSWEGREYTVKYQVQFDQEAQANRINWEEPSLDVAFMEAMNHGFEEEARELDSSITIQCGSHYEKHSGDNWKKGQRP